MLDGRGGLRNLQYATQPRDFRGLQHGTITPTDIDGLLEYHNKGFIYFEAKFKGAELPEGQKLALQRICDDHKKPTIVLVVSHDTPPDTAIDMAKAVVTEYYFKGKWRKVEREIDGKTFQERFIRFLDKP